MSQIEIWRNSRSLTTRFNIWWFATQNWLDRGEVRIDMDKISTRKPLLFHIVWGVRKISKKNGTSHWTSQAEMLRWNSDQTSEKHLEICIVSTENLEQNDLNQFLLINTIDGIRRPLHPIPHGVSGMNTGGTDNERKSITSGLGEWAAQKTGRLVLDAYSSRYSE